MATADKLSYLNTTKTKIRESINLTGAGLTASDTFRSYAVKLQDTLMEGLTDPSEFIETIVENSDKDVATGTTLSFNAYSLWMEYSLLGNTIQDSTTGVQLFNKETVTLNYRLSSSLPPTEFYDENYFLTDYIPVEPNTSYTGNSVFTNLYNRIAFYDENKTWLSNNDGGNVYTITTPSNCYYMRFGKQKTLLDEFMLVRGSTRPTIYEDYTGGQASPNPTYPQEVQTITGNQDIWVSGKNLCYRYEYYNSNAIYMYFHPQELPQTFTISIKAPKQLSSNLNVYGWVNGSTNLGRFGYLSFSQAGEIAHATYTLSDAYYNSIKSATGTCFFSLYLSGAGFDTTGTLEKGQIESGNYTSYEAYNGHIDSINLGKNLFDIKSFLTSHSVTYNENSDGSITFTSDGSLYSNPYVFSNENIQVSIKSLITNITSVNFYVELLNSSNTRVARLSSTNPSAENISACKVRFNWSTSGQVTLKETQLEKGTQATSYAPYFTPIELCKIGNYQDKIFKNTLTSPYYDSNLELDKWYLYKAIGKVVYTGATSENWTDAGAITNVRRFYTTIADVKQNDSSNAKYSNYFTYIYNYNLDSEHFYIADNGRLIMFSSETSLANFKTWLSTHNTNVYYVLNTPTVTEITNETLLSELESVSLITGLNQINVSSEYLPAILDIKYLVKE